jgi:hypothetical protein
MTEYTRFTSFTKKRELAGYWWLMPVILATQEAESRSSEQIVVRSYLKKTYHKKGLVE